MSYQEIKVHFSSIKFEGEEAVEATKMMLGNGIGSYAGNLWLSREYDEEHPNEDEEQTIMVTDLSSKEDQMIIKDMIEDQIECVLSTEIEYFKLVDFKIDWDKSEIH